MAELSKGEREALDNAASDDLDRERGIRVLGPGGTDGNTPTLYGAVEALLAARLAPIEALAEEWEHPKPPWDMADHALKNHAAPRLRAALAAPRPVHPAGDEVCLEFVDTGRCGHSDAEHDRMAGDEGRQG